MGKRFQIVKLQQKPNNGPCSDARGKSLFGKFDMLPFAVSKRTYEAFCPHS